VYFICAKSENDSFCFGEDPIVFVLGDVLFIALSRALFLGLGFCSCGQDLRVDLVRPLGSDWCGS